MVRTFILACLTAQFFSLPAYSQVTINTQVERLENDIARGQEPTETSQKLDSLLKTFFTSDRPGLTALVVRNGETVFEKSYGKASLELGVDMRIDHICRIGSVTKPFTAVAILRLEEQGMLSLGDNITRYVDGLPDSGDQITIEHLLSHTSGIQNYNDDLSDFLRNVVRKDYTQEQIVDLFKDQPVDFAPGSQYRYSNSGYYLLGLVIEEVTGKSYSQFLHDEFFEPLKMKHTAVAGPHSIIVNRAAGYDTDGEHFRNCSYESGSFCFSDGGILSTVHDLCRWYEALMKGELIGKGNLERIMDRYQLNDHTSGRTSIGWFPGNLLGSRFITHDGRCSGNTCAVICFPKEKIFVAVLSNCSWQGYRPPHVDFSLRASAMLLGKEYFEGVEIENAESYAGVYRSMSGETKTILAEDGQLFLLGRRRSSIYQHGGDGFFVERGYETLKFGKDDSGKVKSLESTIDKPVAFERIE